MTDDLDMDTNSDNAARCDITLEERLNSIQELIHELSYSVRAQRDRIDMISNKAQASSVPCR